MRGRAAAPKARCGEAPEDRGAPARIARAIMGYHASPVRRPGCSWYGPGMACVVVRYHEIALKGGNRQRFVQRLIANLRDATTGLGVRGADSLQGRIVMRLAPDSLVDVVCERVAHTFGVANYSA